jgi:hypothetical protein
MEEIPMPIVAYVVIAVVIALVVIALAIVASRRKSGRLQGTFGPEYDRTVRQTGDRRQAERELAGRVERRKQLTIVPLPEQARLDYMARWQRVQAAFVDAPVESVRQADALVSQVMTDRGYPVAEFEQRAEDVSVDHAAVIDNYRRAHAIAVASGQGGADTEALRTAMTQYRALFDDLLGVTAQQTSAQPVGAAVPAPQPPPIPVAPTSNSQ